MTPPQRPAPQPGIYDTPYWRYTAAGELRLQRCGGCERFRYPPGPVCPDCLAQESSWERLSGAGTLLAWTVFHRQYFPAIEVPYLVGAVRTPEGPILIGNLIDTSAAELSHDMPLRAVFETLPTGRPADADTHTDSPGEGWRLCQWTPLETRPLHKERA
ncbi:Zn-ribbon domain-containing OB-fold protein [Streptomyces albipurpureus]|uniref:OB-fold domain-containing protein n=1 Tax=Streptomyces albipurpureus TaxID=2897419 RepID=A0ABT0UTG8_9ACTN|nr:OB-fold domain-containing protein [Streptomyces sp. CWNU-1]MCM2391879.1 OB-fold domain-containing protein [Streptomyces sp. CWNU-1]